MYYRKAASVGILADALMAHEDWDGLIRLLEGLSERDPLLSRLGTCFQRAGLLQEAVDAFCKVVYVNGTHIPMQAWWSDLQH